MLVDGRRNGHSRFIYSVGRWLLLIGLGALGVHIDLLADFPLSEFLPILSVKTWSSKENGFNGMGCSSSKRRRAWFPVYCSTQVTPRDVLSSSHSRRAGSPVASSTCVSSQGSLNQWPWNSGGNRFGLIGCCKAGYRTRSQRQDGFTKIRVFVS